MNFEHKKHWNCFSREKMKDRNCCICQPHESCKDYVSGKRLDIQSGNLVIPGGFTYRGQKPIFGKRFA